MEGKQPCTREKTISSITSFYQLLTQLPYIPPDKLMLPPPTGWPISTQTEEERGTGINATELRNRGKNEDVIDILRHLPYLDQKLYGEHWTLADNTLHINYVRGQLYGDYLERDTAILPLPGHIIWLTEGFERAGVYLLLNTETWEIIEYTLLGESIEIGYDAYEALPVAQKWTAYSAMPADEYFELWRWRHITLQFVLVGDASVFRGTGEWWCKDPRYLWEESFVPNEVEDDDGQEEEDEDYVPSDEEEEEKKKDSDMDNDESEDDSEGEMEDIQSELQSLSLDEPTPPTAPTDPSDEAETGSKSKRSFLYRLAQTLAIDPNTNSRALYLDPWSTSQREKMKQIVQIYVEHGWPVPESEWRVSGRYFSDPLRQELDLSNFRREECLEALRQWSVDQKERERAAHRAATAVEESQQRRKVRQEEIDDCIIPYAMLASVEVDEQESMPDDVILEMKIDKILQGIVDCTRMKEKEDFREICDKARQFLKNWEYLINQATTEEKEEEE
ncbi:hypothetical protein EYB25_006540 [Talaromyces marneffei]|nr:hypothetical protein EYB25_006540 [Talaromyces marneffei]